jgi:hypothetical protein
MAGSDLKLQVLFKMIDGATKPLKDILTGQKGVAKSMKESRDELAKFQKAQKDVSAFATMRKALDNTSKGVADAEAKVKVMAKSLRAFGPPSQQMVADLAKARQAATKLRAEEKQQTATVDQMREKLKSAGIDTTNLASHQVQLTKSIKEATAALSAQMGRLDAINAKESAMNRARAKMNKVQGVAGSMAIGGYAARATASHIGHDLGETLDESKKAENEANRIATLNVGPNVVKEAQEFSKGLHIAGNSFTDNMQHYRDAVTIFADAHHAEMAVPIMAKMKTINASMYGEEGGAEHDEVLQRMLKVIEIRGGTKSEKDFKDNADIIQKVIGSTGGRVGPEEWMHMIQTSKVMGKLMTPDAFFNVMEPMVQEMGGHGVGTGLSAMYNNLEQGKTTVRAARELVRLGVVDKKGVIYNKQGDVKGFKAGALKDADSFKANPFEWMQKTLLPAMAKAGITDQKKILDEFGTILTNGTGASLMSNFYLQQQQIQKSAKLNRGTDGMDKQYERAADSTQGKEADALAKVRDLKLEIGQSVSPLYNAALSTTSDVLNKVVGVMREHETATKVLTVSLAVLAGVLGAGGTIAIAIAGVLGPLAIAKFAISALGIESRFLLGSLRLVPAVFGAIGSAVGILSKLLMTNPWGIALTVLIGSAVLIYENWDKIVAKIKEVGEYLKKAAASWFGKGGIGVDVSDSGVGVEGVPINVDQRPTVTAAPAAPMSYTSQDTYHVQIHDASDPKAVGDEVKRQLAAHEQRKRLAAYNRLKD